MRRKRQETQIDMTPMLDIVFIMLIFFIVTTSFVKEAGIDVNTPSAKTSQNNKGANSIIIAIDKDANIWMDKRIVDIDAIRPNLIRLSSNMPDPRVVINADQVSQTKVLVQVMDRIKQSGIDKIFVAATKDD